MIKKIKNLVAAAALVFAFAAPAVVTTGAFAANTIQEGVCNGVSSTTGAGAGTGCTQTTDNGTGAIARIATLVIQVLSFVVGAIAVIMLIVGGFRYITSGGDSTKVGSAKNTILYAIIGLILVALAQIIVNFVLSQATSIQ